MWTCGRWPGWKWGGLLVLFLVFDLGFLGANVLKFVHGGYVPVAIATVISGVMAIWAVGRANLNRHYAERAVPWATPRSSSRSGPGRR